jgi:RNA polymerase sigma-70 factor (ECF subfamily)
MVKKYKETSDNELVQLFLNEKNNEAFTEIFHRYFEPTYRFIYSRVGNRSWTEDISSETFDTLLDVLSSFKPEANLKSFVIGISVNKIRQFWQKQAKRNERSLKDFMIMTDEPETSNQKIETENMDSRIRENDTEENIWSIKIKDVLAQLPENYRDVLRERFINSKTIKETAEILNISEENVRVLQHRAIKKAQIIGGKLL